MKTKFAASLLLFFASSGLLPAIIPPDLNTTFSVNRNTPHGEETDLLLSGNNREHVSERDDKFTPFLVKSYSHGASNEVQFIAQGPECDYDNAGHRAWNTGTIELFTPTTNVWVQGKGFLFTQTDHTLEISNSVETRVLRSLLKTTMLTAPNTNAPETAGQILRIFSDRCMFNYESNFARYFGHIHVIDVQLDLTSDRLFVQMSTNGAIQSILAEDNVVMKTTNSGWATGGRAYYSVTNGSEMIELTGGAVWHNGDEKARADKFLYDSTRHFLSAIGSVRVWWPNAPRRAGGAPKADATGYRELWAAFATLQLPPTNGPVEEMHAKGNVLIVNQADVSRSTSDQADYVRTNDLFELSGNPVWWNDKMEIKGPRLTAEVSNQVYRARGGSHLKLKIADAARTNQWLDIASEDLDYHTNFAVFSDHVQARLLEGDCLRDTLNSDKLDVELVSNEVKNAVARGHVYAESAPDRSGWIKAIACDDLTAHRSPATQLMTDIVAENHVILRQFGTNASAGSSQLAAATATAYFSPVTNQIERAVAERDIVIDQVSTNRSIHATGQRVDYVAARDELKLTGSPAARINQYPISNSDVMIWRPKTNRFQAYGRYSILVSSPTNFAASKP